TGRPKGVVVSHASLARTYRSWEAAYQLRAAPLSHLQMASPTFDVFTGDLARALCSGGRLVLCPRDILLDPQQLYTLMREQQIGCAEFVPVVLRALLGYLREAGQPLDFLRLLVVGSESWYGREYAELRRLCGPAARVINSYGVTEATIDSLYFEA